MYVDIFVVDYFVYSDAGIYDRVVVQELIKTVAQSHQLDSTTQKEFKGSINHDLPHHTTVCLILVLITDSILLRAPYLVSLWYKVHILYVLWDTIVRVQIYTIYNCAQWPKLLMFWLPRVKKKWIYSKKSLVW